MVITEEDANHYTMRSLDMANKISEHFDAFGSSRLDCVHKMIETDQESVELFFRGNAWGYYPKPHELVFMLAVCHDFSTASLASIVRQFKIDPISFIEDIELNDDFLTSSREQRVDGRVFRSKMVEAYCLLDPEEAKNQLVTNIAHSGIALAFVAGGDCDRVVNAMLNIEHEQAKQGYKIWGDRPLQCLMAELSDHPTSSCHLPNYSPVDFFHKLGAFNPHVVKKTLYQNNCWENLFAYQGNRRLVRNFQSTLLPAIFSPAHVAINADNIRLMLSNLTLESTEVEATLEHMLEASLKLIGASAFSEYASKITFGLSFARHHLNNAPEGQTVPLDDAFGSTSLGPLGAAMQRRLIEAGGKLFQTIMEETLAVPDAHIGYHHLSLPYVLQSMILPKQRFDKGLAEAYLAKMAKAAASFVLEDYPATSKKIMDKRVHQGMARVMKMATHNRKLDYSLIDLEDAGLVDQLVRWGLDVSLIPNPTDKNLSVSLERDLGL
jgi:hypothetical protein